MTSAPRLAAELEAVGSEKALAEAGWVVALLASRHPQPDLRVVMAALWEVLRAEADVRAGEADARAARAAAVDALLDRLHQLPEGFGPKLLDWQPGHVVTRLLSGAWRDHSQHMWTAYEAQEYLGGH